MNHFNRARNPLPSEGDPFAFLDRFERRHWPLIEARFHNSARDIWATTGELLAWLRRDLNSALADIAIAETRLRVGVGETGRHEWGEAVVVLRQLLRLLDTRPAEAARYARHVAARELAWQFQSEVGAKTILAPGLRGRR